MTAQYSADTSPDAHTDRAPPQRRGRRRRAVRWIVHGLLLVALAAGIYGVLPRLGGLTRDAAGLRHARPAFLAAAIVAQAVSLGSYAQLYRRVLAADPRRAGRIEVTLVAITVGFGAPRSTAVLAVLGYRIVNYWLPLIPGAIAYLRLRLRSATVGSREPSTPSAG